MEGSLQVFWEPPAALAIQQVQHIPAGSAVLHYSGTAWSEPPLCPIRASLRLRLCPRSWSGSRKTWSKTGSIRHYWPREWLPKDPAFGDVRIHAYGYNSDWTKGDSNCLNIHHIGKSLLAELSTSPHIGDSSTALVLIGHSMGGLVIKKAYMLAREENKALAERVRSIYFLGTPHRGSDSARVLKDILQVASSAPAYVTELLWTFYETQKLRSGALSTLVVDPESATLGYREEKQVPMNAGHQSICKFDDPSDQNYVIIRNSLVSTIKKITATNTEASVLSQRRAIRDLSSYLGVTPREQDDLLAAQDARSPGTCVWIQHKQSYNEWKDLRQAAPPILWCTGEPGTGKSVLAGFVVEDLGHSHLACSYYFFKHGDSSKFRLGACLRSLAFQMASEDRPRVDFENERKLWRLVFALNLFREATVSHYWVIDALDECTNFATLLDSMLSKMDTSLRLRILITSRETPEVCRLFAILGPQRHRHEHISAEETLPDVESMSAEARLALERRITEKSQGSFLWTTLVLDELSAAFSQADINRILDEVPRGMEPLYRRALDIMALATRGKSLAKAILTWTTCSTRPLTHRGLECASEMVLSDKFPRLGESIRTLCGQLVTVDKNGIVRMVHETAREFLLNDGLDSAFAVCLEYLTGDELKPPRTERKGPSLAGRSKKPELLAYANTAFSSHLAKADPAADTILPLVYKSCCVLKSSPLRHDIPRLRSWSEDLQRVAAKFADTLIASPSSIYSRIPPFCPTSSAIRTIAPPGQILSVTGITASTWDDRLSTGRVVLYLPDSFQEYRSLDHGETVMHLNFRGGQSDMLASAGLKTIHVWNVRTGQRLHQLSAPRRCIALTFFNNLLMTASTQNEIHSWDLDREAAEQAKMQWRNWANDGSPSLNRQPSALSISIEHQMMADLKDEAYYGSCGKKLPSGETSTHPIVALVLNPNASIELLAALYLDSELVILDPMADRQPRRTPLAGGGAGGVIQIFEFDTLRLLYQVKSSDVFIKKLAFSRNGLNLVDLRGSQCKFGCRPLDTSTTSGEFCWTDDKVKITALVVIPDRGEIILCGKDNGSVVMYDISSGNQTNHLYTHADAVNTVAWLPQARTVLSTCLANGIIACPLRESTSPIGWTVGALIMDTRLDCSSTIVHLLPGEKAEKFIMSTHQSDHLWNLVAGTEDLVLRYDDYPPRVWLQHPRSESHVVCLKQNAARIHRWLDLSQVASVSPEHHNLAGLSVKGAFSCALPGTTLLDLTDANGSTGTKDVLLLGFASVPDEHDDMARQQQNPSSHSRRLGTVTNRIAHVIGIVHHPAKKLSSKLVFLDSRSWVCSVELNGSAPAQATSSAGSISSYTRHFFVPYDWFAGTRCPVGAVTTDRGTVVFAKRGDVAVIKGGLEYAEVVEVSPPADSVHGDRDRGGAGVSS
ncbi:hypothetical protein N658DRAFT_568134 [Parathielavia hyrcaniae]|uniref:GPI inositol-deacylase n=1 Tax=Parathielavia hyrcaniae TaxID=113614 RepID=A0AAN6SZF2_9PEZI|nr:hypothetical protein N658DRAFT_568134 [Parathielavia hyrcaniae]